MKSLLRQGLPPLPERMRQLPVGVCCLYTVRGYAYHEKPKGIIFRTGHAVRSDWYAQAAPLRAAKCWPRSTRASR